MFVHIWMMSSDAGCQCHEPFSTWVLLETRV